MRHWLLLAVFLAWPSWAVASPVCDPWPAGGEGVSGPCLERAFKSHGYSPSQAWHYATLLDAFASPVAIDPDLPPQLPALAAMGQCRQMGEQLRRHLWGPSKQLLDWERAARRHLLVQAQGAIAAGNTSGFVIGCGMEASDLERYVNTGEVWGEAPGLTWENYREAFPVVLDAVKSLDHSRRQLGVQWLRASAFSPSSSIEHMVSVQKRMSSLSGWPLPLFGLGGRTAIQLDRPSGRELNGELIYSKDTLLLRGSVDPMAHEWLHAVDYAYSTTPGWMASAAPAGEWPTLLQSLRSRPRDELMVRQEERARIQAELDRILPSGGHGFLQGAFTSDRDVVLEMRRQGAVPRDALFVGEVAWHWLTTATLSTSWVDMREGVAARMRQAQVDGWVPREGWGRASADYLDRPAELLASNFAGVLRACPDPLPVFPLEMPTCQEASEQRGIWRAFFARLPPLEPLRARR